MPSRTVRLLRCQLWQDVMHLWQVQVHPERFVGINRRQLSEELRQGIEVRTAILDGLEVVEESPN